MMPGALWYVYAESADKCWLKGTLISTGSLARSARIYVAPHPAANSSLVIAAHADDLKIKSEPPPTLDIDGTKLTMAIADDGN
jgi:hypothetical protein